MDLFSDDPPPPRDRADPVAIDPSAPLAERMRPRTLDDIVGQDALLAPGRP
jgi:putative ATPase